MFERGLENQTLIIVTEVDEALTANLDLTRHQEGVVFVMLNDIFHIVHTKAGGLPMGFVTETVEVILI